MDKQLFEHKCLKAMNLNNLLSFNSEITVIIVKQNEAKNIC